MCYVDKICKFFLLLVLFSFNLSAQTVTTVGGYPVIDLSALEPLGAVLSSEEASDRRAAMNAQTPSRSEFLGVGADTSAENGAWNAKMSVKFQVMCNNMGKYAYEIKWDTNYDLCKKYSGEDGSAREWRLPTQRELHMIWILHPQLIGVGGFKAFDIDQFYWSATESRADQTRAWIMDFSDGSVTTNNKTGTHYIRCVRDL